MIFDPQETHVNGFGVVSLEGIIGYTGGTEMFTTVALLLAHPYKHRESENASQHRV
jgi:hypothetical protein